MLNFCSNGQILWLGSKFCSPRKTVGFIGHFWDDIFTGLMSDDYWRGVMAIFPLAPDQISARSNIAKWSLRGYELVLASCTRSVT